MNTKYNFIKKAGVVLFVISAIFALSGFSVQAQTLALQPYLQNPAADAMTVMWRTTDLSYSRIEFGTDTTNLKVARTVKNGIVVANITQHKVRIEGLQPNTKYFYRICSQKVINYKSSSKEFGAEKRSEFFSFTTLGTESKYFTCIIFNDLHDNLTLFDKLMKQVHAQGIHYDFSIFNGDIFHNPPSEKQILNTITGYNKGADAANKPAIYLRGNHETRGAYALGWPDFFDWDGGNNYFAFSYGDTRFVFLDNGEDKSDGRPEYFGLVDFDEFRNTQTEWLKKELASDEFKNAFRKILVHHIPIYSWESPYDPGFMPCFDLWDPIFRTAPFDIDITGHLHEFKFYPTNAVNNPYPLVVGGGKTEKDGRVLVLIKRGNALTLKSINCAGNVETFNIR